jgi:hypothetical protein
MKPEANSLKKVQALAGGELSLKARLGYVGLLLVSAALTIVVVALWLTEMSLPVRTQAAFGVMSLIGASWMALATWALRARRPLFARARVIAGRMAVAFSALFVAGCLAAVIIAGDAAAYGALGTGTVMLVAALAVLVRARRRFAELAARRCALESAIVTTK